MKIYVDFDDCLCETARSFCNLVSQLFGMDVPYEKMRYFNLQKTFSLTDEQYEYMMIEGHKPEVLLSIEETEGAYEASRKWLDRHGLGRIKLYCLNKYGRDSFIKNSDFSLEVEDYYRMHFDYAVEDSPAAFRFFEHLPDHRL